MTRTEEHPWAARHRARWVEAVEHIDDLEARLRQIAEAEGTADSRLRAEAEAWARLDDLLATVLTETEARMLEDAARAKALEPLCTEEEMAQRRRAAETAERELIGLDALQALDLYRFKAATLPWAQRLEYDRLIEGVIRRGNPGLLSGFAEARLAALTPAEVRYEAARTEVIGIQRANDAVRASIEARVQALHSKGLESDARPGSAEAGSLQILAVFDSNFRA